MLCFLKIDEIIMKVASADRCHCSDIAENGSLNHNGTQILISMLIHLLPPKLGVLLLNHEGLAQTSTHY